VAIGEPRRGRPRLVMLAGALAILVIVGVAAFNQVSHDLSIAASHRNAISPSPPIGRPKMVSPTTGWASEMCHSISGTYDPYYGVLPPFRCGDESFTGAIQRTTDGGAHWVNVSPPSIPGRAFLDGSYFLDAKHAWISETASLGASDFEVVVYGTSDGGRTWQGGAPITRLDQAGIYYNVNPQSGSLTVPQLDFVDSVNGWLSFMTDAAATSQPSTDLLYRTSDGGLRWSLVSTRTGLSRHCLSGMTFASATTGWMSSIDCIDDPAAPSLLVTLDGGVSWQVQPLPIAVPNAPDMPIPGCPCSVDLPVFFDASHGYIYVIGTPPAVLVTADGGKNWTTRRLPVGPLADLGLYDANHGWAVSGHPDLGALLQPVGLVLYRTDDGGETWTVVPTNLLLISQYPPGPVPGPTTITVLDQLGFFDQKHGFAVRVANTGILEGAYWLPNTQHFELLKTTDGGHTWTAP
jgi:photosystem II stability/assembly factor-like uncharacterized protein